MVYFRVTKKHPDARDPGTPEYEEDMEIMAAEVIENVKWAKFGGRYIETYRGLNEEDWIFDDGANLQMFLSLSEFGKETCGMTNKARRTPLARKIYEV